MLFDVKGLCLKINRVIELGREKLEEDRKFKKVVRSKKKKIKNFHNQIFLIKDSVLF